MEIDPVGGGPGVTSGASGSGPSATSATAAKRRTPGRWRRIPRSIDPSKKVGMVMLEIGPVGGGARVTSGESGSGPSAMAARRRTAGPSEELQRATLKGGKEIAPTCRAERYDLSPSAGRLQEQETGVDQKIRLPTLRFEIVSDQKNPPTFTSVLVEEKYPPTVRAEILADPKITSPLSGYHPSPSTGLLQKRPLQVDMMVVERGSRECEELEERSKQTMLEQAKRLEAEADEGPCDTEEHTEEDKAEFRALKLMYAAACRHIATTKPVYKPPSDTMIYKMAQRTATEESVLPLVAGCDGVPLEDVANHFKGSKRESVEELLDGL